MKTFSELQEGVYDPNILKAFFLAGGPGSGKSYVVRRTTGGLGMKIVNSDDAFEKLLKDAGLSLKMPPEEEKPRDVVRDRAKSLTKKSKVDLDLSLMEQEETLIKFQNRLENYKGWVTTHI